MECPICSNYFNEQENCPRLLKCGHTCCEECLNHVGQLQIITCPTCRHVQGTTSCQELPKNYIVLDLISTNKGIENQIQRHKNAENCNLHPEENIIRYCINDSINVCAECILDHAGHKLLKLDDPVLEFRFEVKNLIGKVSEMGGNLSLKKQELQSKHQNILQSTNNELDSIDQNFQIIFEKLDQRRIELKNKVQMEGNMMETAIQQVINEVEQYQKKLSEYLQNLSNISTTIEKLSPHDAANTQNWSQQIKTCKRDVHLYMSNSQRLNMLDSTSIFNTKALFNSKPLLQEIQKYGVVSVGDDIHNPAVYCFGNNNIVLKFNIMKQKWSVVPIMETNGYEFKNFSSIVQIPTGSILITGGTKSNEVFEYKEQRMVKRCNMLHIRSSHNAVYFNGFVYCIGGYNGTTWHERCEKISIDTYTSVPISNLNQRRCAFSSCLANKCIYVIGGYDGNRYLDSIERYIIALDRWEVLPCMLHRPLQNTGAACYQEGKIIIAGGYNEKGTLSVVRSLDLDTLEWTTLPSMSHSRYLMNKFYFCGGNVYAIGGSAAGHNIEYYCVQEGRWIQTKPYREFTEDTMYKWAAIISHDTKLYLN